MLSRISRTLYTCDDPESLVHALTECGWRRETTDNRFVAAQLNKCDALIIIYKNSEVVAVGMMAIHELDELYQLGDGM